MPSVNNLAARVFVRAAALEFEERDVWGKKDEPEFLRKDPAALTPLLEEEGLPRGSLWESCAIMHTSAKARARPALPDRSGRARDDRQRDVLFDRHAVSGAARATYPTLGFPQYAGEAATSDEADEVKAKAQKDAEAAIAEPLEAFHLHFLDGRDFIGGDRPSIADIRLAVTLKSPRAIHDDFPAWTEDYMSRVEEALGDAYTEPAADVRGFVESVKSSA